MLQVHSIQWLKEAQFLCTEWAKMQDAKSDEDCPSLFTKTELLK